MVLMLWLVVIGGVICYGVWLVKMTDQPWRDRKRKTYRLNFPSDLKPEQVIRLLKRTSGTLRGGRLNLGGRPSLVFEVFATHKGIIHRLRIPYGHERYILKQLRGIGVTPTPETEFESRNWVKAIECGITNPHRQFRVDDPGEFAADILRCLQSFDFDEAVLLQWIVAPTAPIELPDHGDQSMTFDANGMFKRGLLVKGGEASKDEIRERRDKLSEANFNVVLRVAAAAETDAGADSLVDDIRKIFASAKGPAIRFMKHRIRLNTLRDRIHKGETPVFMHGQLQATELAAFIAWPMGNPVVAGLAPSFSRQMPASSDIPVDGRPIGRSNFTGSERPVSVGYDRCLEHEYVIGPSGCLHPDTPIFDPVDETTKTVKQRYDDGAPFYVFALDGERLIVTQASPPVRYRKVGMYELYNDEHTVTVTGQHRVWDGRAYVEVGDLARQQVSVPVQLPTISEHDLSRLGADARRSKGKHANSLAGHHRGCRLCGLQPRSAPSSGLAPSPSRDGDGVRVCSWCGADGRGCKRVHSPLCHRSPRLSMRDCVYRDYHDGVDRQDISSKLYGCNPFQLSSVANSGLQGNAGAVQQSSLATIASRSACGLAEYRLDCKLCEQRYSSPTLGALSRSHSCPHEQALIHAASCPRVEPYSEILFNNYFKINTFRVRPASAETYYDFHVPKYENYLACGLIHHNSGKTALLGSQAIADIQHGYGVIVIESKGDLFDYVRERIPADRLNDVIIIDVAEKQYPVGFNILDQGNDRTAIDNIIGLIGQIYAGAGTSVTAPRMIYHMLHALAEVPGHTFIDLPRLLANQPKSSADGEWQDWLSRTVKRKEIRDYLQDWVNKNPKERDRDALPVYNRTWEFTNRDEIRYILGQRKSSFKMSDAILNNKIILVNLRGEWVGDQTASLIGAMLVNSIWATVRQHLADKPNFLYLDEFADFVKMPVGVEAMLAKSRSRNLGLVLAHQDLSQLDPKLRATVLANTATKIMFRLPAQDASTLSRELGGFVKPDDLINLRRYETITRVAVEGGSSLPATVKTNPPTKATGFGDKAWLYSQQTYGRPIEDIEKELDELPGGYSEQNRPPKRKITGGDLF